MGVAYEMEQILGGIGMTNHVRRYGEVPLMSLERKLCEELNHCSNCGMKHLSHLILNGHSFCNNVCYSEWVWKRERETKAARAREREYTQKIVGKGRMVKTITPQQVKKVSELEKRKGGS